LFDDLISIKNEAIMPQSYNAITIKQLAAPVKEKKIKKGYKRNVIADDNLEEEK